MNKLAEYKNVKKEFGRWFNKETELLQLTDASENQTALLYDDLKTWLKKNPQFRKKERKTQTQISVEINNIINNIFQYGFWVNFYLDGQKKIKNQVKFISNGEIINLFSCDLTIKCSKRFISFFEQAQIASNNVAIISLLTRLCSFTIIN